MVLNCGYSATVFVLRRPPSRRTVCLASTINTEQLRTQLDQLHSEAEKTRAKVNNARLRLMRLSEAAEKLRRQAIISVQTGKDNDARELLFQKKKVMQAMEKSKSRIELLDELSSKLTEAISTKETQLIGNVALDLGVGTEDTSTPVRIVSPKEEVAENSNETSKFNLDVLKFREDEELQVHGKNQTDLPSAHELNDPEGSLKIWNEADTLRSLKGISSYEDLLDHLDQQFNNIEEELLTVLKFSTLVLKGEENPKNLRVQQAMEILEGVRQIRGRIARIMQTKVGIR